MENNDDHNDNTPIIPLGIILDAVETTYQEWSSFLDIENLEIITMAVIPGMYDEEGCEGVTNEIDTGDSERYYRLPDSFEVNDRRIIGDYIRTISNDEIRALLDDEILKKGNYKDFRERIRQLGLLQEWYSFQGKAYRQIAIDWCNENGFRYEE